MAINKDYDATRFETEIFGIKCFNALKVFSLNLIIFVMTLYTVTLYSFLGRKIILIAVFVCVCMAILSYILVKTDRPNMIIDIKKGLVIYLGTLIGGHYLIQILNGFDSSQIGISLGLNTGQAQANASQGWISTVIQFILLGTPIGLVGNEAKRIATFYGLGHGGVTKSKRMKQLQKTITK